MKPDVTAEEAFREYVRKYYWDISGWVEDSFGVDLDPWQREVLDDLINPYVRKISIRACHGPGKTACLAWAALHFILTRTPCKCICTAPSSTQLYTALMNEIKLWVGHLPPDIQVLIDYNKDTVYLKASPESAYIQAKTARADQPEALSGVHAAHVLLIVDEAAGVPDSIFENAYGSMSDLRATIILTSNPTRTTGFFHRTHTILRDQYKCYRIDHTMSPRVTDEFVEEVALTWGRDSDQFRIRCLGEFPLGETGNTLIPLGLIEHASNYVPQEPPAASTPLVWALDVARLGDDESVLTKRRGRMVIEHQRSYTKLDAVNLAARIEAEYEQATKHPDSTLAPSEIVVDAHGIGGPVYDILRSKGLPVFAWSASHSASHNDRFENARAECYYRTLEWFQTEQVSLPPDTTLEAQLSGVEIEYSVKGKLKIRSKQKGEKSPDRADSLMMTFGGRYGRTGLESHFAHVDQNKSPHHLERRSRYNPLGRR